MGKITLVGEANPYGGDPAYALYPMPEGCSGERLCCDILGMYRKDYLRVFDRVNLCPHQWSRSEAMQKAVGLLTAGGKFILFGAKVCSAFGVPFLPFIVQDEILLRLPHPSGRNRMWEVDGAITRAREAVAAFAPEIADLLGKGPK